MQERLRQTEGLSEAITAELSRAQTFLSRADRLSEVDVLSIVRDLSENIYQLVVSLTKGWGQSESSQATGRIKVSPTSRPCVILVRLVHRRDLTGLTCPLWSYLCYQAVNMTSSWDYSPEFAILKHVYQHLSASGEYHIIGTE